jgi:hypothetical protein
VTEITRSSCFLSVNYNWQLLCTNSYEP